METTVLFWLENLLLTSFNCRWHHKRDYRQTLENLLSRSFHCLPRRSLIQGIASDMCKIYVIVTDVFSTTQPIIKKMIVFEIIASMFSICSCCGLKCFYGYIQTYILWKKLVHQNQPSIPDQGHWCLWQWWNYCWLFFLLCQKIHGDQCSLQAFSLSVLLRNQYLIFCVDAIT